jgi:hypothetical protein
MRPEGGIRKGTRVRVLLDGEDEPCLGELLESHVQGSEDMTHSTSILLDDGRVVQSDGCCWLPCNQLAPLPLTP